MTVHTAVPVTHAQPVAAPALAEAALAKALKQPSTPRTWTEIAAELVAAQADYNSRCDCIDEVKLGREPTEEEWEMHDRLESRHDAAMAAAWAFEPATLTALVAKSELLNRREHLELNEEQTGAALARDLARLAEADAELVASGREALRLLAVYREAETIESDAYQAWQDLIPRGPDALLARGIDHAIGCAVPPLRGGIWTRFYTDKLEPLMPSLRERADRFPEAPVAGLAKRAEEIMAARAAQDAACDTPEVRVARERYMVLQLAAGAASDAAEAVEAPVRAAPASTVPGLAAKARLLIRSYQRDSCEESEETWVEQVTRTFLEQVIAADEVAS